MSSGCPRIGVRGRLISSGMTIRGLFTKPSIFNDQMFGIWNFGHCYLFDIWDLLFVFFNNPSLQSQ
jgi:hypothetical protein